MPWCWAVTPHERALGLRGTEPGRPRRGLLLLSRMGISPDGLRQTARTRRAARPFPQYTGGVPAAVSAAPRRVYGSYWNRVTAQWGDRRIDEPDPSEIKHLAEHAKTH